MPMVDECDALGMVIVVGTVVDGSFWADGVLFYQQGRLCRLRYENGDVEGHACGEGVLYGRVGELATQHPACIMNGKVRKAE